MLYDIVKFIACNVCVDKESVVTKLLKLRGIIFHTPVG